MKQELALVLCPISNNRLDRSDSFLGEGAASVEAMTSSGLPLVGRAAPRGTCGVPKVIFAMDCYFWDAALVSSWAVLRRMRSLSSATQRVCSTKTTAHPLESSPGASSFFQIRTLNSKLLFKTKLFSLPRLFRPPPGASRTEPSGGEPSAPRDLFRTQSNIVT
jgi:hypothetical protein